MGHQTRRRFLKSLGIIGGASFTVAPFSWATSAEEIGNPDNQPEHSGRLKWFRDQKFGFFMHWGIYSQWGCIESWPLVYSERVNEWARPDDLEAWVKRDKDFLKFSRDYRRLNRRFNPTQFAPEAWASAARDAGMRYVVFTTKHHDGFSMFDTRQTDYRITHASCPFHSHPRANVTKEIFQAFRDKDFGIGAYFSKADWHHPDYWDPDFWESGSLKRPRYANYDTSKYPGKWRRFVEFTHAQVEELVTGYGPVDILWLDGGWVRPSNGEDIRIAELARMARSHQPGLIVVNRAVGGEYEDYRTPEQEVPEEPPDGPWETCMTMGNQWSHKPDDDYKSVHRLIHLLVDIVAKGGNFLLNVGPTPEGRLPETALQRMEGIGSWMDVNKEAIYKTRPIYPYKEGTTCITGKENSLYLIELGATPHSPPPEKITFTAIKRADQIRMLGKGSVHSWTANEDGLIIQLPEHIRHSPPCQHAWAFEITGGQLGR